MRNRSGTTPPDKISDLLRNAWVCAAASAPTRQERVEEYIKYYKWIEDMKEDEVADKLWLSEAYKRWLEGAPERKEAMLKTFWENRAGAMEVAMHNMVGVATGGGRENKEALQLLDQIATAFPGRGPGKLAEEKKKEWLNGHPSVAKHPPTILTERNIGQQMHKITIGVDSRAPCTRFVVTITAKDAPTAPAVENGHLSVSNGQSRICACQVPARQYESSAVFEFRVAPGFFEESRFSFSVAALDAEQRKKLPEGERWECYQFVLKDFAYGGKQANKKVHNN